MVREVHGIFVTVGFQRLLQGIVVIGVAGVAARSDGPHVPLGFAMHDPFGQDLARPAPLGDPEGKAVPLKRVFDAGHGPEQWQSVGRVWDRSVDVAPHTGCAKGRHPLHCVFDVEFQPLQIVGIQLEAEVFRHWVVGRDPMGLTVAFIGAEVQAVLVLPQVVADINIADNGQFAPVFLGPCGDFGDFVCQEVLVAHHHHRHGAPAKGFEHLAHALCVVARAIHNEFAANVALVRLHDPLVTVLVDACGRAESFDPRTCVACALGHGLGQLRRIDIAVQWIPHTAREIVGFHEGVVLGHLFRRQNRHLKPLIAAHACDPLKFLHPFLGMSQTQRTCDVVVHRVIDVRGERPIHFQPVTLHIQDGP